MAAFIHEIPKDRTIAIEADPSLSGSGLQGGMITGGLRDRFKDDAGVLNPAAVEVTLPSPFVRSHPQSNPQCY